MNTSCLSTVFLLLLAMAARAGGLDPALVTGNGAFDRASVRILSCFDGANWNRCVKNTGTMICASKKSAGKGCMTREGAEFCRMERLRTISDIRMVQIWLSATEHVWGDVTGYVLQSWKKNIQLYGCVPQ